MRSPPFCAPPRPASARCAARCLARPLAAGGQFALRSHTLLSPSSHTSSPSALLPALLPLSPSPTRTELIRKQYGEAEATAKQRMEASLYSSNWVRARWDEPPCIYLSPTNPPAPDDCLRAPRPQPHARTTTRAHTHTHTKIDTHKHAPQKPPTHHHQTGRRRLHRLQLERALGALPRLPADAAGGAALRLLDVRLAVGRHAGVADPGAVIWLSYLGDPAGAISMVAAGLAAAAGGGGGGITVCVPRACVVVGSGPRRVQRRLAQLAWRPSRVRAPPLPSKAASSARALSQKKFCLMMIRRCC